MDTHDPAEESLASRKHIENARSFMLVLLLLVAIAALHLIWTCLSIRASAQTLADKQRASSFLRDEDLALHRYLLDGDAHELTVIEDTQKEMRQLSTRVPLLNGAVDLEDSWYINYAQPLIQKRKQLDAGTATLAEIQILYLQLRAQQAGIRAKIDDSEVFNKLQAMYVQRSMGHMANVRVTVAILIAIAAMLVAMFGLRHITALREQA